MKPLNRKLPIVIFSQDVDNKLEAPCVLNNLVNMFAVRINIIMKTTRCLEVLDLHMALLNNNAGNLGIEGNRLIPSH